MRAEYILGTKHQLKQTFGPVGDILHQISEIHVFEGG